MQNLKKERREYMKQRQRLRMQGHDVNMCKNVIDKDLEGFSSTTTDNQKEEESSSLTGLTNQGLLFVKRPDIDVELRMKLSINGLSPSYRNCTIKELCAIHNVSHEFIYAINAT